MLQPHNGGLGVQQNGNRSPTSRLPCYLDCVNNSKKFYNQRPRIPCPVGTPGSSMLLLLFSNLEPSDQIVSTRGRPRTAVMASAFDGTSIRPADWLLDVCIVLVL